MDTFFATAFNFNDVRDHPRQHSLLPTGMSDILDDVRVHLQSKDDETFNICCICQGDMIPTGDLSVCRCCLHYECDACTTTAYIDIDTEDEEEPAIALPGHNSSENLGDMHWVYSGNPFNSNTNKELTPMHPGRTPYLSFPNYTLHLDNREVGYPKTQFNSHAPRGVDPKDTVSGSQLEINLLRANSYCDFGLNKSQHQEKIRCCQCSDLMEKFVYEQYYCRDDDHFQCCDCIYESVEPRHQLPTGNPNFRTPKKYVLSRGDSFRPVEFIELRCRQRARNQNFRVSKHYVLSRDDPSKTVKSIKPRHHPHAGKQNFRTPKHYILSRGDPSRSVFGIALLE
ncbi:hypothetical protein MMC14_001975 [Varicellaria rhodocarpa]|nr:hypothetical protein [Varicellaria rhodocarpa]